MIYKLQHLKSIFKLVCSKWYTNCNIWKASLSWFVENKMQTTCTVQHLKDISSLSLKYNLWLKRVRLNFNLVCCHIEFGNRDKPFWCFEWKLIKNKFHWVNRKLYGCLVFFCVLGFLLQDWTSLLTCSLSDIFWKSSSVSSSANMRSSSGSMTPSLSGRLEDEDLKLNFGIGFRFDEALRLASSCCCCCCCCWTC
jgi:hypothetical protein